MNSSIEEVTERHAEELMAIPGVVSVGIGRSEHGSAIIVVGLESAQADAERAVPNRLGGFEVRTEIVGTYKAQ